MWVRRKEFEALENRVQLVAEQVETISVVIQTSSGAMAAWNIRGVVEKLAELAGVIVGSGRSCRLTVQKKGKR